MSQRSAKKAIKISRDELNRLQNISENQGLHNYVLKTQKSEIDEPDDKPKIAWPELKSRREKTTDVETQLEAEHYLARAKLMKLEQEDEVKTAKKIILAAKCQAIRDAQMAERERLVKELKEDEERLDKMMESERLKGLRVQAKKKEQVIIQRNRYVNTLLGQIEENESKKTEDKHREFKESQKLREMHKKLDLADEEAKKKQEEAHIKVRQELNKMNDAMKHRRLIEEAEEKMANLRIQQYMRTKAAREAEREEKKRRARMAQEMEIAHLRACQVRQQEVRAKEEAAAIERDQEKVARAWREKELESLKKRVKLEKDLREARAKQAEEKKRLKDKELEREAKDVETLMGRIEDDKLKQQEERIKHEEEMQKYRKALSKQMSEKQKRLEILREQRQKDAEEFLQEQNSRKADLQEIYNIKLKELRGHRIPEKYIHGVEKQLKLK